MRLPITTRRTSTSVSGDTIGCSASSLSAVSTFGCGVAATRLGILGQQDRDRHQAGEQQDRDGPEAPLHQLAPDVLDRAHRTPVIVAEVVGGVVPSVEDDSGVAPAGACGEAPAVRPCVGGSR